MRLLLDTHIFLWFVSGDPKMSATTRTLLTDPDNQRFVSVASVWEMSIKHSLGKLELGAPFETLIPDALSRNGFSTLPIEFKHLVALNKLPLHHRDPFDRLVIAQAITEQMTVVSADLIFGSYPVQLTI